MSSDAMYAVTSTVARLVRLPASGSTNMVDLALRYGNTIVRAMTVRSMHQWDWLQDVVNTYTENVTRQSTITAIRIT